LVFIKFCCFGGICEEKRREEKRIQLPERNRRQPSVSFQWVVVVVVVVPATGAFCLCLFQLTFLLGSFFFINFLILVLRI
jgi:hypothetical protein